LATDKNNFKNIQTQSLNMSFQLLNCPQPVLTDTGENIQLALQDYIGVIYEHKWLLPHIENLMNSSYNDVDLLIKFIEDERIVEHFTPNDMGLFPYCKYDKLCKTTQPETDWNKLPHLLQEFTNMIASVLYFYPALKDWFLWQLNYGMTAFYNKYGYIGCWFDESYDDPHILHFTPTIDNQ
jgi:hypothetical protein